MDLQKIKQNLLEREYKNKKEKENRKNNIIHRLSMAGHIFNQYPIHIVYLYGSTVSGKLHHYSDIDIAVEGDIDYKSLLHLYSELSLYMQTDVDVRLLKELPCKESIKEKGIIIYEGKTGAAEK